MAKVIFICGKICCGKSTYAEKLRVKNKAVILSIDEIMLNIFGQYAGEKHDEYAARTEKYLLGKSLELVDGGINVVLDWGSWTKAKRSEIRDFFTSRGIDFELHCIDITDEVWKERIDKRNGVVSEENNDAYYVDENLIAKFKAAYEPLCEDEIDVLVKSG